MSASTPFTYVDSWQHLTAADVAAVQAFWLREDAHVEGAEAARRAQQVVIRALSPDGQLAAITTVEPRLIPRLMQPMYYYRCFIGAVWRKNNTLRLRVLLQKTFEVLEPWSRERDFPCIGVVLELENAGFERPSLQRAYWSNRTHNGYSYIGRSARGLEMRVRYFMGARLKTDAQVVAMLRAAGVQAAPAAATQASVASSGAAPSI
ncbi:MAG TPA: hypothetical protein VF264_04075 [Rhodanobacteraceae bacterium]